MIIDHFYCLQVFPRLFPIELAGQRSVAKFGKFGSSKLTFYGAHLLLLLLFSGSSDESSLFTSFRGPQHHQQSQALPTHCYGTSSFSCSY